MAKANKWIEEIEKYKPPLENRSGMRLDFNENPAGASNNAVKAVKGMNREQYGCYPEYRELCKAVSKYCSFKESEVLVTNGSDEAIDISMRCFVKPRSRVILVEPTFPMFRIYAQAANAKIKKLKFDRDLKFPLKELIKAVDSKTSMVVLCSPNNPTGSALAAENIEKILRKAKNAAVLVDEAYYEFSGVSCAELARKYENLIVTRTFSKAFGLAGARCGYAISNSENISIMQRLASPYKVNSFAVNAVIGALKDREYVGKYVREVKKNKKMIERELEKLGFKFYPSAANFVLVDFGNSRDYFWRKLREQGILVRNMKGKDLIDSCLRITIAGKEETSDLIKGLRKISETPALVFDMDGVLIDVSKSYRSAIKKTIEFFSENGISYREIQKSKYEYWINNDWELTKKILETKGKKIPIRKIISKFQSFYIGKKFDGFILREKLLAKKSLLESLAKEYRLAVFTGRPRKEAEFALEKFGIRNCFSEIVVMEDVPKEKSKPNPFGLELIKTRLKVKKGFYFGDMPMDINAAKAAGIRAVGVGSKKTLEKYRADTVLDSINKIKEVLE